MSNIKLALIKSAIFMTFVGCWITSSNSFAYSSSGAIPDEQIDQLVTAYYTNRVLILSNSTHKTSSVYSYLERLLGRVGDDPYLKFIVLERLGDSDSDSLLQKASVVPLNEILPLEPIQDPNLRAMVCEEKNGNLEGYGEWAYTFASFLPFLNSINQHRAQPVLARSIDGVFVKDMAPEFPPIHQGDCINAAAFPVFIASRNRELDTANNYLSRIYSMLKPDEKAIIVYHYWHVTQGLYGCMGEREEGNSWKTKLGEANWITFLQKKHPQSVAEMNVVVLDESGEDHPNGVFVNIESSLKFAPQSFIRTYLGGEFNYDSIALNRIFMNSFIVPEREKIFYRSPKKSLPIFCGLPQ